jgi:hypothetical protein
VKRVSGKHWKLLSSRGAGRWKRVSNRGVDLTKADHMYMMYYMWHIHVWNTTANPPWAINIDLKLKDRRVKQTPSRGSTSGRGEVNTEGEGGWIW